MVLGRLSCCLFVRGAKNVLNNSLAARAAGAVSHTEAGAKSGCRDQADASSSITVAADQ